MRTRLQVGTATFEVAEATRVARWTDLGGWTATWAHDDGDPAALEPQATLLLHLHEDLRDNPPRLASRIALDGLRALPREVKDHAYDDGVRMAQVRYQPIATQPDPD